MRFLLKTCKNIEFFCFLVYNIIVSRKNAPIAQLDGAFGYGPKGCGFDSYWAHQIDIKLEFFRDNTKLLSNKIESSFYFDNLEIHLQIDITINIYIVNNYFAFVVTLFSKEKPIVLK